MTDNQETEMLSVFDDKLSGSYLLRGCLCFRNMVKCPDWLHSFTCQIKAVPSPLLKIIALVYWAFTLYQTPLSVVACVFFI